jgi:hypothetical protein
MNGLYVGRYVCLNLKKYGVTEKHLSTRDKKKVKKYFKGAITTNVKRGRVTLNGGVHSIHQLVVF